MSLPSVPDVLPRSHSPISRWIGRHVLSLLGWKIVGNFPEQAKFVVAVAPHTSNWDFVIAIATKLALDVKVKYLGKDSLFFWPLSTLLISLGGIPVKRHDARGMVEQLVAHFEQENQLILGIAPEGTRKKTRQWKTGFLRIAHHAKVPVVALTLDYRSKTVRIFEATPISSDIDNELLRIQSLCQGATAKYPDLF